MDRRAEKSRRCFESGKGHRCGRGQGAGEGRNAHRRPGRQARHARLRRRGGGRAVIAHRLDGVAWPLLVYPAAIARPTPQAFEELFTRNRWPAAWRNGVFPFHHYHSNSHEVLGVYEGEVTVQFGGALTLSAKPGDVIVLPAGTAHKKLSSRGSLEIGRAHV